MMKDRQQARFHIESGEILLPRKCCRLDEQHSRCQTNSAIAPPHSTPARGISAIVVGTVGSTQLLPIAPHVELYLLRPHGHTD